MPLGDSSDDDRKRRLGDGTDSESDDDELRAVPSGVVRKRKGWEGDGLELEHAIASSSSAAGGGGGKKKRKGEAEGGGGSSSTSLKDSFQNKEVGHGYQHQTVMRQKGVGVVGISKVVDMTGNGRRKRTTEDGESEDEEEDDEGEDEEDVSEEGKQKLMKEMAESFMENEGLRKFKLSITRLLKSSGGG
jgi:hypothetical protein